MVPYLIATEGPNAGSTYLLEGRTLVGRCEDCDIQLLESDVSRRHALILKGPNGTFRIGDLSSTNGTFVSGDRIAGKTLGVGDTIHMGTSTFLFLQADCYADVLDGLSVDDLKLVSGPAAARTRELPLGLPAQVRRSQVARRGEPVRKRHPKKSQEDVPTRPMQADMAWAQRQESLAEASTGCLEIAAIPLKTRAGGRN